jgi:hypothetical protein
MGDRVLRLLLVIVCLLAAAVWIDASWNSEQRSLVLRLRASSEIVETVRDHSRDLGRRVVSRVRDHLPAVGASPPKAEKRRAEASSATREHITLEDQESLDRLIAEKTREP